MSNGLTFELDFYPIFFYEIFRVDAKVDQTSAPISAINLIIRNLRLVDELLDKIYKNRFRIDWLKSGPSAKFWIPKS